MGVVGGEANGAATTWMQKDGEDGEALAVGRVCVEEFVSLHTKNESIRLNVHFKY